MRGERSTEIRSDLLGLPQRESCRLGLEELLPSTDKAHGGVAVSGGRKEDLRGKSGLAMAEGWGMKPE